MAYDLVIRNGIVVDGTGLGSYLADVGVQDGLITKVGRIRELGIQEIDADGFAVSPGFIDGPTPMDPQV
jgi:N-acyl-D-aspartate/D-glutamate deacylase